MKKITVLGNFSGRNAGDAAILGGLLRDISTRYKRIEFYVPTINTSFVDDQFHIFKVKSVGMMPWNLSAKILGIPVLRSVLSSDLILVTDAILFDRKLYNPLYNYLWTLSKILPLACRKGIPVVLYNSSLGPVHTSAGKQALKNVIDAAEMLILRDEESLELIDQLGFHHPNIIRGADCALNAEPVGEKRFREIVQAENLFHSPRPVIGMNVNSYVDAFMRHGADSFGRETLVELYASTVDRLIAELGVDIIFVETQHMDMKIARNVLARIKQKENVRLISNKNYSYGDICSVLKKLELFVGMRTHSLILSSAMGTVPVGIVTYPKNRGYMRTIGLQDNLIEFKNLTVDNFSDLIIKAFQSRRELKNRMIPELVREKAKARDAALQLMPFLRGYSS